MTPQNGWLWWSWPVPFVSGDAAAHYARAEADSHTKDVVP